MWKCIALFGMISRRVYYFIFKTDMKEEYERRSSTDRRPNCV